MIFTKSELKNTENLSCEAIENRVKYQRLKRQKFLHEIKEIKGITEIKSNSKVLTVRDSFQFYAIMEFLNSLGKLKKPNEVTG